MHQIFKKYSVVFVALGIAFFARLFLISVYKIPTESMSPTFLPGDVIITSQVSYGLKFPWSESTWFKSKPQKGDLVILNFKNKPAITYLKRVAGVEGDEVKISDSTRKVGPDEVYVLSDNPNSPEDSRDLGLVPLNQIEGRAQLIWFSMSPKSEIRWRRVLSGLK